jgi:UDP-2,4-diacetamido-2,4,6-trideoxy-beta-L-altropyranose hydrolase
MQIVFRVDSYNEIAVGHLSRCINLASTLEALGNEIIFISYDDDEAIIRLKVTGFKYYLTKNKINDQKCIHEELSLISKHKDEARVVIVDSYEVNNKYFDELRKLFLAIVYLDDLGLDFEVDMVINPSSSFKSIDYIAPTALCGLDYLILNDKYKFGGTESVKTESMLITFGGVDHYDLSSKLIPLIESIDNKLKLNIIIGPYYDNLNQIKTAINNSNLNIQLYSGLKDLRPIMLQSDIAITAGGVSIYELMALSIPSIGIALWDNQKSNIESLARQGAIIPLYYFEGKEFEMQLIESLKKLISDVSFHKDISDISRSIIDGNGALRISKIINKKYGK